MNKIVVDESTTELYNTKVDLSTSFYADAKFMSSYFELFVGLQIQHVFYDNLFSWHIANISLLNPRKGKKKVNQIQF